MNDFRILITSIIKSITRSSPRITSAEMINFTRQSPLDEKKATQVAGRFLKLNGGSINYMLLIKLMYMTDRTALEKWDRPVTNDTYWSLKHGPILSSVYDLIADEPESSDEGFWSSHISPPSNYFIRLLQSPGEEDLTREEIEIIDNAYVKYGKMNLFALAAHLHDVLPEWKNPGNTRLPISIQDILVAVGRSTEDAAEISSEIRSIRTINSIFA